MNLVHVLVEGQTEEAFLARVIRPHLWRLGVHVVPKLVVTRRVPAGPDHKGGVTSWAQIERDVRLLLGDSSAAAVTTHIDYYGLPADVPGMSTRPSGSPFVRVRHVEAAIASQVAHHRFRAHLALHEFEAILYSAPEICGDYLAAPLLEGAMRRALGAAGEPELVNDDPASAPSKRILAACPTYSKTLDGPALAERVGLVRMRAACPHFNGWIDWLESLGPAVGEGTVA
ncbi:MAG TPA: DUF4276 family protein [Acidimicrobiales bacterium]|jgi:hypothetical protein|nr:DUF4276 family protein [Acidimicrobiales bacterium]